MSIPKAASVASRYLQIPFEQKQAFNKYNPDDLLTALVDILEKYELDDVVREVKKLTPAVQKAWRNRET